VRLHRRQFAVGPRPVEELDGWEISRLAPDLYLSRCPTLPVRNVGGDEVLGLAVPSDDSGRRDSWAGRFVVIRDGVLEMDPTGLLGVFSRDVAGERWISSSPELLRGLTPELESPGQRLRWAVEGNEWFAPPFSGVDSMTRLLPSQRIRLTDGVVEPKALLPSPTEGDPIADAERRLRRIVRELSELGPLWVALTSGRDSRLVLAACLAEGIEPVTFTFDRAPDAEYPVSASDRELAPRLAELAGLEHRMIEPKPYDPEAASLFDRHCCFHSVGAQRYEIVHGQWDLVPANAIVVSGGVFEAGRAYYRIHQPPVPAVWMQWVRDTPQDLEYSDRLYIEQRLAGWLSSAEQAGDLTGRVRICPANCAQLLASFLTLPVDVRARGAHHTQLIERMAPELAAVPFNPRPVGQRIRARWNREAALVHYHRSVPRYAGARAAAVSRRLHDWIRTVAMSTTGALLSLSTGAL